jgi:hypothetical protein
MTEAEREKLLSAGATIQAMVVGTEPSAADRRIAPVDQAKASRERDPLCLFCHQPVPVTPVR